MKKLAVLTSLVFVFGISTFAMADPVTVPVPVPVSEINGNDIVKAGGAAANDGGTAVAVNNNLSGNSVLSGNKAEVTNTSETNTAIIRNDPKDSYNKNLSTNDSINTIGASGAFAGSASNVGGGSATVNAEYHVPGEVVTTNDIKPTKDSNNWKLNSDQANSNNRYEVEVEHGDGNAATMKGKATVDSRDQSTHTDIKADAKNSSIAAINTVGTITLDESFQLTVQNIGMAVQKNELRGSVEHNKLTIDAPKAESKTQSGKTESGKVDSGKANSGKADSGKTESTAGSISGSSAQAVAVSGSEPVVQETSSFERLLALDAEPPVTEDPSSGTASATASSKSGSKAGSESKGGNAQSGNAKSGDARSGDAKGGDADGDTATASTTFLTGTNDFKTSSFNGLGSFNVNSGVGSLQQSPVRINAVVGGSVAGAAK